jgi:integrase
MRLHLTEIAVRALKPKPNKQYKAWDSSTPGFGVLVSEHSKSCRSETHPATGTLAHAAAHVVRFDQAFREYIEEAGQRTRATTLRDYKRLIAKHFNFGTKPLPEITPQAILKRVDGIADAPAEQRYALVVFKIFMRWCERRFYLKTNPCDRLKAPGAASARERVLTDTELATVLLESRKSSYPFGAIVELLILTGQRRGEIAALRWEWIDDETKTITLPSSITKNKRPHTLPYGELTATVFAAIPRVNKFLFPAAYSRLKDKPATVFNGWSKSKGVLDSRCHIQPWTLHDLRRTFATNLAALGTPIHVTEKLLNHVSGTVSGVAAIYNRHAYLDEMRAAIDAWEKRLSFIRAHHNSDSSNGSPLT